MLPSSANSKVHFFSGVCVYVYVRERKRMGGRERGEEYGPCLLFFVSLFVLLVLFQNSKLFQFVSFLLFYLSRESSPFPFVVPLPEAMPFKSCHVKSCVLLSILLVINNYICQ